MSHEFSPFYHHQTNEINPSKPCSLYASITIATVMSEAILFFLIWTDVQLFNSLYNFMSEKHFLGTDVTICATVHPCAHEQTRYDAVFAERGRKRPPP